MEMQSPAEIQTTGRPTGGISVLQKDPCCFSHCSTTALPLVVAHPGRPSVIRSITAGVWECIWGFLKSTFCLTRDSVSMFLRGADRDFLVVSLPGFRIKGLWPHSFFFRFIYLIYLHVCLPTFMCTMCIQVAAEARRH